MSYDNWKSTPPEEIDWDGNADKALQQACRDSARRAQLMKVACCECGALTTRFVIEHNSGICYECRDRKAGK